MSSRLNHPGVTASVTAVCYFIFLLLTLNQRDPGTFPQAGEVFTDTTITPGNIIVVTEFTGYDGQFYYRLALNPFTRERTDFGIQIDSPRYRHQRILYPLLAWIVSFGSPPLVTYALILVNFLSLIWIGYSAGWYAHLVNRHALWGLAFSLFPGFLFTLSRDLVEIIEACLILLGLVALTQKRAFIASGLFSLAILAKETALLTAVSLISQKKYRSVALLPLAVFGAWQLFLNGWWGVGLAETTPKNIGLPFVGIVEGYLIGYEPMRWQIFAIFLAVFLLIVAFYFRCSTAQKHVKLSWLLYTLLLVSLTKNVWVESLAFLRAASLFYLFGTAVLLQTNNRLANICLIGVLLTWLWLAFDLLAV